MYDDFVDSIAFNGNRYSVKLRWKEGHDSLPSNYELSLSRMKGQIKTGISGKIKRSYKGTVTFRSNRESHRAGKGR